MPNDFLLIIKANLDMFLHKIFVMMERISFTHDAKIIMQNYDSEKVTKVGSVPHNLTLKKEGTELGEAGDPIS